MSVTVSQGTFASSNGINTVHYKKWSGSQQPRAILQLVHGMSEYIGRYDEFARFMVENGFVVYGHDHIGHGDSVARKEDLGYFAPKDGYRCLVDDVYKLSTLAKAEYPGIPHAVLGHSMGSFVSRLYAAEYPDDADMIIFCGTSGPNPASGAGILLASIMSTLNGERFRSAFINRLAFGSYNSRIKDAETDFDWLSADRGNVRQYIADELCGFSFTLSGFRDLFTLLKEVSRPEWAGRLRKTLPVMLISGADDPVGSYGKGVTVVRDRLDAAGIDCTMILYDGLRHEILREGERQRVWDDVLSWLDGQLARSQSEIQK